MNLKLISAAALVMFFTCCTFCWGNETQPPKSLSKLIEQSEELIFGVIKDGNLHERFEHIESTLFSKINTNEPFMDRAKTIRKELLDGDNINPSLILKVNFIEWSVFATITQASILDKLDRLETSFSGKSFGESSIVTRVKRLLNIILPGEDISFRTAIIPEGTLIEISLLRSLHSNSTKKNERFGFVVCSNTVIDNLLVIPAGSYGVGDVVDVKRARWFGRRGKLYLNFKYIFSIDGSKVAITIDKKASTNNKKMGLSITTSLLGAAAFGPVGLVGGFFIKGSDVHIAENQKLYVSVGEPISLRGIKIKK